MFYIPTSPFIFKYIIIFSLSFVFTGRLYTPYKSALYIIFAALNLIFNCLSLEFTIAVYKGLPTGQPFFYILCVPYIFIQFNDII